MCFTYSVNAVNYYVGESKHLLSYFKGTYFNTHFLSLYLNTAVLVMCWLNCFSISSLCTLVNITEQVTFHTSVSKQTDWRDGTGRVGSAVVQRTVLWH
jgi:hypothetical protein